MNIKRTFEEFINEKREDVGKYNTVKKVIAKLGRRPSEQDLASFITNNYYDVTEVERGEDDPQANDKIADLVAFYKFDIEDWGIAWADAQNESVVFAESVDEAFIGPFVFNDRMSDEELKAMYNGALDGYANYSKGFQHSKSDYKKAYQEIEKILKKRGVSVDESVITETESIKVGEYIKTQYGYFYKRVDGKVGGQEAFVEIKKGKEGKRKTSIHDTVNFEIVDKDVAFESVVTERKTISSSKISMMGAKILNKINIGDILDTEDGEYEIIGYGQQANAFKEFEAEHNGKQVKVKLTAMYGVKLEVTDDVRSARFNKEVKLNSIILESVVNEAKTTDFDKPGKDGDIYFSKREGNAVAVRQGDLLQMIYVYDGEVKLGKIQKTDKRWENMGEPSEKLLIDLKLKNVGGGNSLHGQTEKGKLIYAYLSESVNEAKMPDKFIGNDEIVFLKTKESSRGAHYNLYYKGHDIDFGGRMFGSEKELKQFADNYILSNQWYNKLRYEDAKPLPESVFNESKDMTFTDYLEVLDVKFEDAMAAVKGENGSDAAIEPTRGDILQNFTLFRNYVSSLTKKYKGDKTKLRFLTERVDVYNGFINELAVNEAKFINRDAMIEWLQETMKFVSTTEEFDGSPGGIWVSGEDGETLKGKRIYNYYANVKGYTFGVLDTWEKELNKRGWYSEWYDAGTVMIWQD